MKRINRRTFIAGSLGAAAGAVLAGCSPAAAPTAQPDEPTAVQAVAAEASPTPEAPAGPTATSKPRPTPTITLTPTAFPERAYRRPALVRFHPDTKSAVVRARDPKVWNGDKIDAAVVRTLLDSAMVKLTGQAAALDAWKGLFEPTEKIAIKVNAFRNSTIWTHTELVYAVTDSLVEAGIPAENITIFDYLTSELETAGFTINPDGPGVRCYGTDNAYSTKWPVNKRNYGLSDILVECDALINMPVLKSHMIAGITFALKNHYGSIVSPDALHSIAISMPALSILPAIKETTRLVIGDILHANTKYSGSWPYWEPDTVGDSILLSYDPVAADYIGREILAGMAKEKGENPDSYYGQSDDWFKACTEAGLGAADLEQIDLMEI